MFFPTVGYSPIFLDDDDEEVAPTERSGAQPPKLTFNVRYEPLFTSATWTIEAKLNDELLFGEAFDSPPSNEAQALWAREFIKKEKQRLKSAGVDVMNEFVSYGGEPIEF